MGRRLPGWGIPLLVEGMAVLAEAVAVGVGLMVGVAEGVAVKAGAGLSPAAKTVNLRVSVFPR